MPREYPFLMQQLNAEFALAGFWQANQWLEAYAWAGL